ncbi:hypothetical protein Taro_027737 [Colocasia esculenta]|uniref:Cytoplasmic tRNA 2-thiolation protein 2 n=1 Tax=Colocasia esculenta TaxID=4460 RepID=A0A843VPP8_COLES|nr:hypothetical protein [Colocasia esculenta]
MKRISYETSTETLAAPFLERDGMMIDDGHRQNPRLPTVSSGDRQLDAEFRRSTTANSGDTVPFVVSAGVHHRGVLFTCEAEPIKSFGSSEKEEGRHEGKEMASCGGGGGGGCGSGCLRDGEEAADDVKGEEVGGVRGRRPPADRDPVLCSKCGEHAAFYGNLCGGCFRFSLFGKFKLAVTSKAMISPTDKVLVALSGGPASRVALQFVHEMQFKAQKSWDASKDQSLPVFGVGVAFIDETMFLRPSKEVEEAVEEIRCSVSQLAPPAKVLHIATIGSIFSADPEGGTASLNEVLEAVSDATGKEDLLHHLRVLCLQKIALDNGYSKLVLGSCTTTIARKVLSATVKGQGYSLPADIQYVDARWAVPVVLPLRDCLAEELTVLCHLDGLKIHRVLDQPHVGINNLVSSFVTRVQDDNPSRARTIVRTAEKLRPFHFNKVTENLSYEMLPSRVRRKLQSERNAEATPSEVLCSICGGPLSNSDIASLKASISNSTRHQVFAAQCCQSCCFQILPKEEASLEHFYSLMPPAMTGRVKDVTTCDYNHLRGRVGAASVTTIVQHINDANVIS